MATPQASQASASNQNSIEELKENVFKECEVCTRACIYNPETESTICTRCAVDSVKAELEL